MRRSFQVALLSFLIASSTSVPSVTAPVPRGSSAAHQAGSGVKVLSSGLRVIFLESRSNPMVASTVAVLSGVRDETPATNGASHFLEHMLFDGTTSRTQEQIQRDVEFIGGYNNATTRDELTLFMMLAHRDKLERALDVQADMLFRSTIPAEAFERERKVVLEELARDTSQPGYGPEQFFKSRYYAGSARAMPVLGSPASIGAVTRDAVYAHYKKNYRPGRMVLFLAGDFDRAAILPVLERTFGAASVARPSSGPEGKRADSMAKGAGTARRTVANPSGSGAPSRVRGATRPGFYRERIDGERGYLRIGIVGPGVGDPDAAAFGAIAAMLGGGPGSRLARALMGGEEMGAIDASADYVAGAGEGRLEIQATLQPGSNGLAAIRSVRRELRRLTREPVPVEELRAYVAEASSEAVYLRDQVHYLGMSVGSDLILGPRPSLGVGADDLAALTPASLQQVAARWLEPSAIRETTPASGAPAGGRRPAMVVTLSSPSVSVVADPDAADLIPDAAPESAPSGAREGVAAAAAPPDGGTAREATGDGTSVAGTGTAGTTAAGTTAAGTTADTVPGVSPGDRATADSTVRSRTNVRRAVFENGLTVLVGENADSQVFAAHVLIRDRAAMEPTDKIGIADVLHRLLPYGSLYLDGEGLSLKLKTIGARLKAVDEASIPYDDYYNSPRYSYVRFETTHANWREGLGLLFTTVAYPRFDDTDVALAVSEEIDISRKRAETPSAVARDLYSKAILKDGPLSRPVSGTPITLAKITPDELRAFHARYFSPEQIVLSIVSDVPATDVLAVLHATFGRMKRTSGAADIVAKGGARAGAKDGSATDGPPAGPGEPPLTEAEKRVETQTGRAQSQILMGRVFAREDKDFPALIVATTVLSQAIGRELRDARGLAYAAGCTIEDYGDRSWFTASVGTRPENVADAESAIREAIRAFPGKELEESVVERAVNSMRGSVAMRRMTRISQAYSLGFNELLGRPPEFDASLDARLADVRAADVRRVVGAYLDPDRLVTAVAK